MFIRRFPPFLRFADEPVTGTSTPPAPTPTPAPAAPATPPASEATPAAPAPEAPAAPAAATPPVPAPPAGAQPPAEPAGDMPGNVDDLPEWAQKELRSTRKEAQGLRQTREASIAQAKQAAAAEVAQTIGKALGLVKDDAPPADPETLIAQAQTERQTAADEARVTRIENAVLRHAPSLTIGDALLDSRTFTDTVKALDPTADDFASQVEAAIKTAIEQNPTRYAAAPAAAPANTGGSPITGTPAGGGDSVDDYRKDYRRSRGLAE